MQITRESFASLSLQPTQRARAKETLLPLPPSSKKDLPLFPCYVEVGEPEDAILSLMPLHRTVEQGKRAAQVHPISYRLGCLLGTEYYVYINLGIGISLLFC